MLPVIVIEGGGVVVNISSSSSIRIMPQFIVYFALMSWAQIWTKVSVWVGKFKYIVIRVVYIKQLIFSNPVEMLNLFLVEKVEKLLIIQ